VHLCIKTVERAHSPKNLWEKILLSRNYSKALTQIDEHLAYFPKTLVHRNKQRLTKIHQYLIRMRKIELKQRAGRKTKMVHVHRKIEQREERRERKALIAAKLERSIEKELIERLAKGTYGDIYNFPEMPYKKALENIEAQQSDEEQDDVEEEDELEAETNVEYVEDLETDDEDEQEVDFEDMEDMEYLGNGEWAKVTDDDEVEDDDSQDLHSDNQKKKSSKMQVVRGPRIEIEYEDEFETIQPEDSQTLTDP
jgi:protein MAK16